MDKELKPCPFPLCKGTAELITGEELRIRKGSNYFEIKQYSRVRCIKCGCQTGELTEEEVVELWNTRHIDIEHIVRRAVEMARSGCFDLGEMDMYYLHTPEEILAELEKGNP